MLNILHTLAGRAVHLGADGTLYLGRHYAIYRVGGDRATCTRVTSMPRGLARRAAEPIRMMCRMLRHEVRAMTVLSDGTYIASNRVSVYYGKIDEPVMIPSRIEQGRTQVAPPMCLTVGPQDHVLWGEYIGGRRERREIRMYVSDDAGRSYSVFHRFEPGAIRHVHNIVYDQTLGHYWVLAGDHGDEPGIGRLSANLKDFEWVVKGEQHYRAVCVFDLGDHLVYGTDSELEPNAVMSLDKATGRVERLMELDGSCIYACRFGGLYALSTTVEPSTVNRSREAALWLSRSGRNWTRVFCAPKDRWSERYFQYGSLILPRGESNSEDIIFSGQAVRGLDGKTVVASVPEGVV